MRSSSIAARVAPLASLTLALSTLAGCAGGGPLLHPARTLPKGEVRVAGGLSGDAIAAGLADGLRNARNETATNPNAGNGGPNDGTFAKGALVAAAVAPGIAPYVGARVGVGYELEGGLTYTGRAVRVDARRAFRFGPDDAWAVSIGAGGSAALYGRQQGSTLPGVDLGALHGWGADVPILIGYESTGGIYMLWLGARAGYEHVVIEQVTSEPKAVTIGLPPIGLKADRYWAGGLVGMAVGFRHVHVALELDASYMSVNGTYGAASATVSGLAIVPASALWWDF